MTTAAPTRAPRGLLSDHTPGLTRDIIRDTYTVPTVDDLRALKPNADHGSLGNRWRPIHHADYLDALISACIRRGLEVSDETYHLDGHTLRGYFSFANRGTGEGPDRTTGVMGFLADNAQNNARTVAVGEQVWICTNGMVIADYVVKRKSTTGLNVQLLADTAVDLWCKGNAEAANTIGFLKQRNLHPDVTTRLLGEAVGVDGLGNEFMSVGMARRVRAEYDKPRHEVFNRSNAWCLYNAATETLKHEPRMSNDKAMQIQLGMTKLLLPADIRSN
jgi:hypothetical protein